jgi:hypothetical protein
MGIDMLNGTELFVLSGDQKNVDFYGTPYAYKMCRQVYSSIGRRIVEECGDLGRDSSFSKMRWAALTRSQRKNSLAKV